MAQTLAAVIVKLALSFALLGAALDTPEKALDTDDECLASDPGGAGCAVSALQLRSTKSSEESSVSEDGGLAENASAVGLDADEDSALADDLSLETAEWGGWSKGGDKMWGHGAGIEVVNSHNVGYYNRGIEEARGHCGDAGCVLIVNPPGHRTVNKFHIHFVHYHSYGRNLKKRVEQKVCGRSGWHGGGLPCHGKAAFFPGFPGIFSKAMEGGSIHHASLIAWPRSCGGSGTIVQLAYGCSIEHQLRGDYNPAFR